MNEQERFDRFVTRYPHPHRGISRRTHWTRREFFQVLGAGVTGSFLGPNARASSVITQQPVQTKNTAKSVVFILLQGAPSHIDTFDFKMVPGVTPSDFNPANVAGITW